MKDLKVIIGAVVIFLFAVILMFFAAVKNSNNRAFTLYKQGLSFYLKNDYQNAYYNFSKISALSELYDISLLKQGFCALNSGDKRTAYQKFKYLSIFSNNIHITPVALYQAALINMEHKKYSHAYKKFKKLYKKYPDSDYKKAAAYQLGLLFKDKNPQIAKEYFIEYLEYAPSGRFSLSAIEYIYSLKIFLTNEEKCILANALFDNKKYSSVVSITKDLNSSSAFLLCARAYEQRGDYNNALNYYTKTLVNVDDKISEKDIATVVSKCIRLSNLSAQETCATLLKATKKTAAYPAVLFEYASYLPKMSSIKCYEIIYKKYPNSYQAAQSLWNVFLYTYKNGYSQKAKELAQEYLNNYSNKKSTPAMKFWHAKILLEERKTSRAKQEFKELIKTEPDSYYAYVSYNLLKGVHTPFNTFNYGKIGNFEGFSSNDLMQIFSDDKTLVLVASLNDIDLLKTFRLHNDFALSYIAKAENNMPYSVFLARKAFGELSTKPQHKDARYKLAYPLVYQDTINKYSIKYSQNPYLMLALIREESTFNRYAKSSVGASGLMQLMPSTASYVGFNDSYPLDLFNPEVNINLGIKYLSYLKNMFEDSEMLAVLSYNGGPSNVSRWSGKLNELDFNEFVEDIPYSETQNYIKRVFGSYWNYIRIYCK